MRVSQGRVRLAGCRGKLFAAARRFCWVAIAILVTGAVSIGAVVAQTPQGILAVGNAAVTGFSGVMLPGQIPPGADPADKTYIDLNGPSTRVIDLQNMGGPPQAQLVNAPKPYTATAAQVGQVFGVAIDNVSWPNIYVAASSAYGLPIVAANNDRLKVGAPGAVFMQGQWGPAPGGPGSIWKIDGITGAVSLFANVTLNGVPNSGPALGGLAFDSNTNTLFVADRDTGMIHRFGMNGAEVGRYDHGVQGRPAVSLPPVPDDPANRLNIQSPLFNTQDPSTWAYTQPERLVFGLGVKSGRLYYAVADGLTIWSVAIGPGSFGDNPRIELQVPPGQGATEISKIVFDGSGRMYLAERPAPTGAYDFEEMAQAGTGRVLRYAVIATNPDGSQVWQPEPDEYAIGFPAQLRNDNGGVDIGYSYDPQGILDRRSCGGFLWSTGEQLRNSPDPALAARLGQPVNVDGLQGNPIELVRPQNVPPLTTYFIDYDDKFDDAAARGHMGDIVIRRVCGFGWNWGPPGIILPPPPLDCPPDQRVPGYQCCPKYTSLGANGQCVSWCPPGVNVDPNTPAGKFDLEFCSLGFDPNNPSGPGVTCLNGQAGDPQLVNDPTWSDFACASSSPVLNPAVCQAGYVKETLGQYAQQHNQPVPANQAAANLVMCFPTPAQEQCGGGEGGIFSLGGGGRPQIGSDGQCHQLCPDGIAYPVDQYQCCAPGTVVNVYGQCCPPGSIVDPVSGLCECTPGMVVVVDGPKYLAARKLATQTVTRQTVRTTRGYYPPDYCQCIPGVVPVPDPNPEPVPPVMYSKKQGGKYRVLDGFRPGYPPDICPPPWNGCDLTQNTLIGYGDGAYCCPNSQVSWINGVKVCCSPRELQPGGRCNPTICPERLMVDGECCRPPKKIDIINDKKVCCGRDDYKLGGKCFTCPPGRNIGGECCLPPKTVYNGQCCSQAEVQLGGRCNPRQACPTDLIEGKCCTTPPYQIYTDPAGIKHCCTQEEMKLGGRCNLCPPQTTPRNGQCCSYADLQQGGACNPCPPGTHRPTVTPTIAAMVIPPRCVCDSTNQPPVGGVCPPPCQQDHVYTANGVTLCCSVPVQNNECVPPSLLYDKKTCKWPSRSYTDSSGRQGCCTGLGCGGFVPLLPVPTDFCKQRGTGGHCCTDDDRKRNFYGCGTTDKPCDRGYHKDANKRCVPDDKPCDTGYHKDANKRCVPDDKPCDTGYHKDANKRCVPDRKTDDKSKDHGCSSRQHWDGTKCVLNITIDKGTKLTPVCSSTQTLVNNKCVNKTITIRKLPTDTSKRQQIR